MTYAKWDPTLETGNELVDSQHKELFNIINELHDSIVDREDHEIQAAILARLMSYAEHHFTDEEALMRSIFYPGLTEQKAMHKAFKAEARELSNEYTSGKTLLPITLAIFLHDWLVKHIRIEDRKIGEFIRAKQAAAE